MHRRHRFTATAVATALGGGALLLAGPGASQALGADQLIPGGTVTRLDNRPNGDSPTEGGGGQISGDGRVVLVGSPGPTLGSGDRNDHSSDVYLVDQQTGKNVLITHNAEGKAANGPSGGLLSTDGRSVLIESSATDLPGAPTDNPDGSQVLYDYDIATGTFQRITPLLATRSQTQTFNSFDISGNGRYVTFSTAGPMSARDTNHLTKVYLWDAETGRLSIVSRSRTGARTYGYYSQVSDDGHVAFNSGAANISPVTNPDPGKDRVYVWDPHTGRTTLVSGSLPANLIYVETPQLSENGRYVLFGALFQDSDGVLRTRLFSYDVVTGRRTQIVDTVPGLTSGTDGGQMTADGRYVLVQLTNKLNPAVDGFRHRIDVYDQQTRTFHTFTDRPDVMTGQIEDGGRLITFGSTSPDYVSPDTNGTYDGFLWTADGA